MIPAITSGGRSFQGAFAYYMHDKNANTTARIAWTHTMNMMTDCVKKAWRVMAYTAKAQQRLKEVTGQKLSGRKLEKPVFAYSLAWHPEQKPGKQAMLEAAQASLEKLGLTEHEVAIAAHKDEQHPHIHIIVNRVHPVTGMAAKLDYTKRKLSDWALEYEQQQGKVYCKMREENHRKRQQGQHTQYNDPTIVKAWERSHNAHSFHRQLENKDYHLARGRKRLVVVDPYDKTHNPTRYLKGIATAKEFRERMAGLDYQKLPTVEAVIIARRKLREENQQRTEEFEASFAEALSNAAARQNKEITELVSLHINRIEQKRSELKTIYKLAEQQAKIDDLNHQLQHPGFIQKWSFKIFGSDQKLKQTIAMLEANKADARQRMDEAITPLEKDRDRYLERLKQRHIEENKQLASHLKRWKPAERTLRQEWSRSAHERDISRDRVHGYDTPDLGR